MRWQPPIRAWDAGAVMRCLLQADSEGKITGLEYCPLKQIPRKGQKHGYILFWSALATAIKYSEMIVQHE